MNKAYRYRLYPTIEQKIMFAKTFGSARFIYNKMLGDRLEREAVYNRRSKLMHEVVYTNLQKPMHEVVYDFFGVPAAGHNRSFRGKKSIKQGQKYVRK